MGSRRLLFAALVTSPVLCAQGADDRPERPVEDPELQKRINAAIGSGVAYLRRVQNEDGSWTYGRGRAHRDGRRERDARREPAFDDGTGGLTALALYALAASGVPADDPAIQRGVDWTCAHDEPFADDARFGTYSASLLTMALTRIDPKKHRKRIHRLATRLVEAQQKNGQWTYWLDKNRTVATGQAGRMRAQRQPTVHPGDNSNTQFAVLGLWAAQLLAKFRVPSRTWKRVQALYDRTQQRSGGFAYKEPVTTTDERGDRGGRGFDPTVTMTAAGLVSWVCATASLKGGVRGLPRVREHDIAQRGLEAFQRSPKAFGNYYLVYSIERVGTFLDVPDREWYPQGAERLLRQQEDDGRWVVPERRDGRRAGPGHGDQQEAYETALALLFLSRATVHPITQNATRSPRDQDR